MNMNINNNNSNNSNSNSNSNGVKHVIGLMRSVSDGNANGSSNSNINNGDGHQFSKEGIMVRSRVVALESLNYVIGYLRHVL